MAQDDTLLSEDQQQALGKLASACVGACARVLSDLVLQTVRVEAPELSSASLEQFLGRELREPVLAVRVEYVSGVEGSNLLLMKATDALAIAALMLGEEPDAAAELDELRLSALAEAMNQMMGSAATELARVLGCPVAISPPVTQLVPGPDGDGREMARLLPEVEGASAVILSFPLYVDGEGGASVESRIFQVYPAGFAAHLAGAYLGREVADRQPRAQPPSRQAGERPEPAPPWPAVPAAPPPVAAGAPRQVQAEFAMGPGLGFAGSDETDRLSMEVLRRITVPVTVRLGQAYLSLEEVMNLSRGSIVPLDVSDGQAVDVLVSGTVVARGEVVVVKEHFGVRITELVRPDLLAS